MMILSVSRAPDAGAQLGKFAGGCLNILCRVAGWLMHFCVVNILQYTRIERGWERAY